MTAPLVLLPFRYRDARTGRWVKARYKATRDEITARYAEQNVMSTCGRCQGGLTPARAFGAILPL